MGVFQIKKYKIIKDENGNDKKILKTKEEYNNETRGGTHTWYFKVYKNKKTYKSKKYKTKKEAQEEEALFLLKRDNPTRKPFTIVAIDYLDSLKETKKESTHYSYKQAYELHILPYFKDYNINNINVSNIKEWADMMQKKGLSLNYLNLIDNILKNIFDFGIKNYGLKTNPAQIYGRFQKVNDKIKPSEKIKYITYTDFNKFISVIDNSMWKTFFIFLYYTGMRKGEVQALTWNDIDFDSKEITVNKTLSIKTTEAYKITSTKNNITRKIKMSKTLIDTLLEYKKEVMEYTDFSNKWFIFGNSRFLPQTTIYRYKDYYFKLAKIKPITIHEFRHSHVSLLVNEYIKSGQTDTTKFFLMMSNRMGHSIEVMQEVYMHLFPTVQEEIVDILDNL